MTVAGYGVRFGGADLTGDQFTSSTDFWIDDGRLSPNPPVLFEHGRDQFMQKTVVGKVTGTRTDSVGLWVEAQLRASKAYMDAIRRLVKAGVLGWSSGSAPQFVDRTKSTTPGARHDITSWGVIEMSLTPNPAEPRCLDVNELKSLAALDPSLEQVAEDAVKAELSADARNNLSNSDFAYVDSDGGTHLPINDAAHVRAAISRFGQTDFESPEKKKVAARKILAKARSLNIDFSPDSAIAMAAKSGGPMKDQLPDTAFARVDKGDTQIEGKTYPLEQRHYPHHDENGVVDPDTLNDSLKAAAASGEPASVVAHLKRHAMAVESGGVDDAHTKRWSEGAAPVMLVLTMKMAELTEELAQDRLAMERTGIDTKSGGRIIAATKTAMKDLHSALGYLLENADGIERGDDGTAQVSLYRAAFDLLDLEEAA